MFLRDHAALCLAGGAIVGIIGVSAGCGNSSQREPSPSGNALWTLALVGDTTASSSLSSLQEYDGPDGIVHIVRTASLAVTNLEATLFNERPSGTWALANGPHGRRAEADVLTDLGFDIVTRANNHAADFGVDGLTQTTAVLEAAGLRHVGVGGDLTEARSPIVAGTQGKEIAFLSATVSSVPESRATNQRGEIKGRPGVNPLRFTSRITVDAKTFDALKAPALQSTLVDEATLTLFGQTVTRGDRTNVSLSVDESDREQILRQIDAARMSARVVVLALHSHEPSNNSQAPAEFVRDFARASIERGASIVVGHGPHRLRGIEVYRGGVIFYSLGDFLPPSNAATRALDVFDAGIDLYALALGALGDTDRTIDAPTREAPSEGVIVLCTFREDGSLSKVQLYPLDFSLQTSSRRHGAPRLARADRAVAILELVMALSAEFDTVIRIGNDGAQVELSPAR